MIQTTFSAIQYSFVFTVVLFILSFGVESVRAGATLEVNDSTDNNSCDEYLTVREATELGASLFSAIYPFGNLNRPLTEAERNQISGVSWVTVIPGCGTQSYGYAPNLADMNIGYYFSDNIVFTNAISTISVAPQNGFPGSLRIGLNDHINGLKPNLSKVVLDGSSAGFGVHGLNSEVFSGSNIRNLEIRNFNGDGIRGLFYNAVFEGLIIHHNGRDGIALESADNPGGGNPRGNRIGDVNDSATRNFIYSNGRDGIAMLCRNVGSSADLGNVVENTYIGYRNSDANTDDGNGRNGIFVDQCWGNRIGGENTNTRNFIGGNGNDGINMRGSFNRGNRIINNIIGRQGAAGGQFNGVGNAQSGVALVEGAGGANDKFGDDRNTIGEPGSGNIISGNRAGVYVSSEETSGNVIQSNYIGTNFGGADNIGNETDGVFIGYGAKDTLVGGDTSAEANVIAFNNYGVYHQGGIRNLFRRNEIRANTQRGIDLAPTGTNPNDLNDPDTGANNLINYPVLNSITGSSTTTSITGKINSLPNTQVTVDFYGNTSCHTSGNGEARRFLGKATVSIGSNGIGTINSNLATNISNAGQFVTATATSASEGTSELSRCTALNCTRTLSATGMTISPAGGPGSFNITSSNSSFCPYFAISNNSWITVTNGSGNGNGTVSFTVATNETGSQRTGTITVGDQTFTITQQTVGTICTYSFNPTSANNIAAGGANGNFAVNTQAGCQWNATSQASWITTSSSGTGSGTVNFTVAANSGAARTGTITVNNQTFTVNQLSGCGFTVTPLTWSVNSPGGTDYVDITATGSNCAWTMTSNANWITANTSGTGSARAVFSIAANTGPARTGTITVAGQTVTVNQASGCQFTINPTSATFAANGGNGSFSVTTTAGCAWSATPGASWITTTSSGNGNGTVNFTVAANTGATRSGTITVGTKIFNITQSASCTATLTPTSTTVSGAGGTGSFNVNIAGGCTWTAASNATWISINPIGGNGGGVVTYTVSANTGAVRTGTITAAGQTFTITQSAACSFTLSPTSANYNSSGGTGSVTATASDPGCPRTTTSSHSWLTVTSGGSGTGSGTVNYSVAANGTGTARSATLTISGRTFTVNQAAATAGRSPFDFDGDNKTDISIFRPAPGEWWYLKSSNGGNAAFQFGSSTDKIVPADYTGDGKTDIAFWRPSNGNWYILRSEDFSFYAFPFGTNGDVPVPADYDGDGKADAAVFRPSTVTWFISKSSGGTDIFGFGASGDKPVVGDYDGDSKADIAIFRPNGANGAEWWIRRSSNGSVFALQFGLQTDKAVQGDYTGDGKADVAFWRPSNGNWYILRSEDFSFYAFPFGENGDIPAPGDYDGDGKFDATVFRPSETNWYISRSSGGTIIQPFGNSTDKPVPSAFIP